MFIARWREKSIRLSISSDEREVCEAQQLIRQPLIYGQDRRCAGTEHVTCSSVTDIPGSEGHVG